MPPEGDEDNLRDWKREINRLWVRVFIALNKTAALGVAVLIHKVLERGAEWVVPENWTYALKFLQGTFFLVFSLIYLHFLWEMLAAFVPSIATRRRAVKVKANAVVTSNS
jgi:hypothetical protein